MLKLIIIDDERATREKLIENIQWDKLNIQFIGDAKDGVDGLELIRQNQPDIVLLDVRMPRMNGIECAAEIRKISLDCKIIFLSGFTDKEYLKSAIQLNAVDYIEKPIDLDELFIVLNKTAVLCQEENKKKINESILYSKAQQNATFIKQELALEMIRRNTEPSILKKRFDDIKINIPLNENYRCILLRFNVHKATGVENDFIMRKEQVLEAIYKEFTLSDQPCIAGVMDRTHVVVQTYGKTAENNMTLRETFRKIQTSVNDMYQSEGLVTVGVGSIVRGIENTGKSYQHAQKALQQSFFKGHDSINFYENKEDGDKSINVDQINQNILNYLKDGDLTKASLTIEDLVSDIKRQAEGMQIQFIKAVFLSIMLNISSLAKENGLTIGNEWNDEQLQWASLLNTFSIDEIKYFILEKLGLLFKQIEELKGKSKKIRIVMEYIKCHYNEDISVVLIAEHLGMRSTYLSTLFKKETGKTLGEYIESVRIEKARELLKNDLLKLTEVSSLVGYNNANYFTTVFKKVTGMYPSDYRRKNIL